VVNFFLYTGSCYGSGVDLERSGVRGGRFFFDFFSTEAAAMARLLI
jgi:hypothetical protein